MNAPVPNATDAERRGLRLSAAGNLFIGLLGVGFAIYTRSDAIMLDGFFSFIAFFMGLLTIRVARLVQMPDDDKFHFGYAFHEPLMNTIKGLTIVAVCGLALASAIDALLHGGRALNVGGALTYAVVATAVSIFVAVVTRRVATKAGSPLLAVDVKNWLIGGAISSGVALGFLAALLIQGTSWSHLVPYVDPALLVALVSVVIWIPLRTVWQGVGELLQVAPDPVTQAEVRDRVHKAVAEYHFDRTRVRMVHIGRYFYVLVHVLLAEEFRIETVGRLDAVRRQVQEHVKGLHPRLILDVVFTGEEPWID